MFPTAAIKPSQRDSAGVCAKQDDPVGVFHVDRGPSWCMCTVRGFLRVYQFSAVRGPRNTVLYNRKRACERKETSGAYCLSRFFVISLATKIVPR